MLSRVHGSLLSRLPAAAVLAFFASPVLANDSPELFGIPLDFILFAVTLLGVALFHHHVRVDLSSDPMHGQSSS